MATNRITLAGASASVAMIALAAGVVVSTVESRHHKDSPTKPAAAGLSDSQRQAVAQRLNVMQPVGAVTPTTECLQAPSVFDACFSSAERIPTTSSPRFERFLADLDVTPSTERCNPVKGGAYGDGIVCLALGTWNASPVSVFAFSPTATATGGGSPTGVTGTDLTVSVVPALPS